MNTKEHRHNTITHLAALLLLGLFALCLFAVLLYGVKAYRQLTARDRQIYDSRTCAQYLATKVRQAPVAEAVALSDFAGGALVIRERLDGQDYVTRIYCHQSWLMELFTADADDFSPQDGEKLLEVQALTFGLEDGLLEISITPKDGMPRQLALFLRGGEEGAYEE